MNCGQSGSKVQFLPSYWAKGTGSRGNSRHLEVTGQRVKYIGPGNADKDAASVRADTCVPPTLLIYYFEVEIISKGRDGYIGVGFCTAGVNMDRLPGWEPESYGYHGDDGNAFRSDGKGKQYGPTFGTGDVIGAALNRADRTISYYKNGIDVGVAFHNVTETRLYPCVGMQTHEEEVLANFGDGPFRADVEGMRAEALQRIEKEVQQIQLPSRGKTGSFMGELVFDYLLHHSYFDTAAVVARDLLDGAVAVSHKDVEEVNLRRALADAVVDGRIDEAMAAAERLAPGVLRAHPNILFRLHCQKFIELVRLRDDEGAMSYGRTVLVKVASGDADQDLLQDALSLLGYDDPAASPCSYLLSSKAREDLAKSLSAATLSHTGRQEHSALDTVKLQLDAVLQALTAHGDPNVSLYEQMRDSLTLKPH